MIHWLRPKVRATADRNIQPAGTEECTWLSQRRFKSSGLELGADRAHTQEGIQTYPVTIISLTTDETGMSLPYLMVMVQATQHGKP